ncbi:MAG: YebC/PmpR family DNA-binding transcriptional regulator, partial [Candidatus Omnitrophica bacterium]|nr:YebC/PmpR family DNA-binding transcriptional regulator [Candidatus Omnitrophota bacterium]
WMFQKKGYILVEKFVVDEDTLMTIVLDAGAEDMKSESQDSYEITTSPSNFEVVKRALSDKKIPTKLAELTMVSSNTIKLTGNDAKQILSLVDILEEHDDVQNVYSNFDIPDEVLREVEGER